MSYAGIEFETEPVKHDECVSVDPMELAAAAFDHRYRTKGPIGTGDLHALFPSIRTRTFYWLLDQAVSEGLVRIERRFGAPNLVHPVRMV